MSAPRNALGRGLGALLPAAQRPEQAPPPVAEPQADAGAHEGPPRIRVDRIDPNPDQPRRIFESVCYLSRHRQSSLVGCDQIVSERQSAVDEPPAHALQPRCD